MQFRAEVINLDGAAKIRVSRQGYLVGYFRTVEEIERALHRLGYGLADIDLNG